MEVLLSSVAMFSAFVITTSRLKPLISLASRLVVEDNRVAFGDESRSLAHDAHLLFEVDFLFFVERKARIELLHLDGSAVRALEQAALLKQQQILAQRHGRGPQRIDQVFGHQASLFLEQCDDLSQPLFLEEHVLCRSFLLFHAEI